MKHLIRLILTLGLLLGVTGCPIEPVANCTTTNCSGCCDAFDQCQVGSALNKCGSGGNLCDVCVSPQVCQLGRCGLAGQGGGGGTTGGGTGGGGTGGGGGSGLNCNTTGIATGCTASAAFSCDAATSCFPTYSACVSSGQCGTATGGGGGTTGGGGGATGGGGGASITCNTAGTATGCNTTSPFSCDAATSCFATWSECTNSLQCGGTGQGGGAGGGGGTGTNTVSGRVTYDFVPARYVSGSGGNLYFSQVVAKPVRNAVVRVLEGTAVLATGNTAADGAYALSYTPTGAGALQVQVLARTTTPAIQIEDNTANNATWAYGVSFTPLTTTVDLYASSGWNGSSYAFPRRAAPFAILDSMYTAARAFMAVRTVTFPALKVNWSPNNAPQSGDKAQGLIGTSHFASSENEIYVLGLAGSDTDEFDSHVIVHEWGHYFEANMARSDSPGGPHGRGDVLDPRIAFGEAWGTAVAAMVLPETMYTDSVWSGATLYAWGYDAETVPNPTDDPTPNAFSENAVLRAIYDLYDATSDGAFDQVGVGLGVVYDVLNGPQRQTDALTTLASFVTALKAQPGANVAGINAVLAQYNVGPVTSDFGVGDGNLEGMFTPAPLPFSGGIGLGGGFPSNSYQQNQYYVFTGTGRRVYVTAGNATQDVWIAAFRKGAYEGWADSTNSGTEAFDFISTSGVTYVLVVQGFGQVSGNYTVSVSITSP